MNNPLLGLDIIEMKLPQFVTFNAGTLEITAFEKAVTFRVEIYAESFYDDMPAVFLCNDACAPGDKDLFTGSKDIRQRLEAHLKSVLGVNTDFVLAWDPADQQSDEMLSFLCHLTAESNARAA